MRCEIWHATYLDVAHLDLLLFESIPRLGFAVVKCAVGLLAPALDLLADAVVFALLLRNSPYWLSRSFSSLAA
jgi:hypothetical protein